MTISGDTVCSVIQAFPVLLILAQNSGRCLKTHLIYHPPSPTHSPEYYEALDALFQSLYGHGHGHGEHGHSDHGHGCDDHNHGYQYHGDYGYGKKSVQKYYYNQKPCHGSHKPHYGHTGHGQSSHGYGQNGHNSHGYGHTSHTYGYPTYVLKVKKNHGHNSHDGTKIYAPNQVHNIKQKYKIVVRNHKGGRKSAPIKIQGFFPPREDRGFSQSILNPSRIRNTLQGILHLQPQAPNTNPAFVYPFNNRPTDRYGRPTYDYGRPNYEYGRPNYEYDRPNYEYGRPGITNNNMTPNQNQFSVPNRNDFQEQNGGSQNGFQYPSSQNGFQYPQNQNGFQNPPNQVLFPSLPPQNEFPNNGNGFQNPPSQNGFQNQPSQNGFQEAPSQVGFPDSPTPNELPNNNGNGFQEYITTNGDANSNVPKEDKQSDDTFIVIPGNTEENKDIFASSYEPKEEKQNEDTLIVIPGNTEVTKDIFASSDSPKEAKENEDTLIVIPGNTEVNEDAVVFGGPSNNVHEPKYDPEASKVTEETPKITESTTVSVAPEYPPLTPVSTGSRNNFNFGPSGIFQETCTTVDNGVGSCLPVTECPPYLKMIQESRSNPNALRLLRQAHCGFQGTNPKVCCPRPGFPTDPPTTSTTTTEQAIVMPVEPEPSQEPKEPEPQPAAPVALPEPPVCGFSNASLSRVVGGIPAKLGDFPWMALLGYKERRAGAGARWLCGGSLISARHVLTAAHCIHTRENDLYLVRLGELDIARDDEGATPVDVLIKTNIKHEEYNPKSFTNDIGILVLSRNVQFTDLIQPICIPRTSELRGRSYENYRPLIAGWGDTEFRGPSATHLQVLQLPVVTNDYCAQAYSAYKAQVIDQRVLCAGFKQGKQDACQGDSGGPLMLPVQSSETRVTYFYQIGVVSYGKKCAEPGFPGVYTRVTNFVPWIEDTVARN